MNGKILLALFLAMGLVLAIQPAEDWTQVSTGKYAPIAAGAVVTEGGNVTNLDLEGNVSTEKWAGFWGDVTGLIVLAPNNADMFYTWTWDPGTGSGGKVCALYDNAFDWVNVQTMVGSAIDTAWSFGADTDSGANTFVESCNMDIAGIPVVGTDAVTTGTGGGDTFQTCALADNAAPAAKGDIAFCVEMQDAGTIFDGNTGDYELLTATDEAAGTTENYNFWLELN